jgi:hypothetical protein
MVPSPPSPSWCSEWDIIFWSTAFGNNTSQFFTPRKWVSGAPGITCDLSGVVGILIETKLRKQMDAKLVELHKFRLTLDFGNR